MNHLFRTLGWSLVAVGLSGCAEMTGERVLYDQQGVQVGIQADPTISRSTPPARNSHPATLSPNELRLLLGSLQISGWSGTLVGLVQNPQPIPFLSPDELDRLADPIATALGQAGPTERVSFSLQNKERPYSPDRTTGMLFIRGPYLHLVVTDHAAFIQADTGGGEEKDLRDTKGMKLWTLRPVQAAAVQSFEEPRWSPFETVHISLNMNEALTLRSTAAPVRADRRLVPPPATGSAALSPAASPGTSPAGTDDQRLQLRELTRSNLDLRERLDEQAKQVKELKEELARLQLERRKAKSKSQPPRKSPAP